jgi:hypothetical protein
MKILTLAFVFSFMILNPIKAEEADLTPVEETAMPEGYEKILAEEEAKRKGPEPKFYRELGVDVERAGFERYYYQGDGFQVTDFFGIGGGYELFDDPKKINDLVSVAGLEASNFGGVVPDDVLRRFLEPVRTQNLIAQGTLRYKAFPRFRYIFTNKQFDLQFVNEDKNEWHQHVFDVLYGLKLFERDNYLIINPIYERRYIDKKDPDISSDIEDIYLLQYSIFPVNWFELFGQLNWSESESEIGEGQGDGFFFRLEPRFLFTKQKLRITPGWFHSTSDFSPSGDEVTKDELSLDIGKDFTRHWRTATRFEVVITENDRTNPNPDIEAEAFNFRNKVSYELLPGWDVSLGAVYGEDFSDLDKFDHYGFFAETEYVRYGLFRGSISIGWNDYFDLNEDEILFVLRINVFRF